MFITKSPQNRLAPKIIRTRIRKLRQEQSMTPDDRFGWGNVSGSGRMESGSKIGRII